MMFTTKLLEKYTKKEFLDMDYFEPTEKFDSVIIVPTDDVHDSGYRCMKFILCNATQIVGVVGGYSDVLHINGIGGYGNNWEAVVEGKFIPPVAWRIDCLTRSRCVRLICQEPCEIEGYVMSDCSVVAIMGDKK